MENKTISKDLPTRTRDQGSDGDASSVTGKKLAANNDGDGEVESEPPPVPKINPRILTPSFPSPALKSTKTSPTKASPTLMKSYPRVKDAEGLVPNIREWTDAELDGVLSQPEVINELLTPLQQYQNQRSPEWWAANHENVRRALALPVPVAEDGEDDDL